MYNVDREKQIREVMNKLEQLVLKAEELKDEALYNLGEDSLEYSELMAYEEGIFQAFAIVKKTFEGDYE